MIEIRLIKTKVTATFEVFVKNKKTLFTILKNLVLIELKFANCLLVTPPPLIFTLKGNMLENFLLSSH